MDEETASTIVEEAWEVLPPGHRSILAEIRADRWALTTEPLGTFANQLLLSVGKEPMSTAEARSRNHAVGLWLPDIRHVLLNCAHPSLHGLDAKSYATALAFIAWHEWGHALAYTQADREDIAQGPMLLELLHPEMAENIRGAGYGQRQYTHEIVADIYAVLMARRRLGRVEMPTWLHPEIRDLIERVVPWTV